MMHLDDILITGPTVNEHLQPLETVLDRLAKESLHIKNVLFCNIPKTVDPEGLHPIKNKTLAIVEAPCPSNPKQLKAYLGLITYYAKFLQNLSSLLSPLYKLLHRH